MCFNIQAVQPVRGWLVVAALAIPAVAAAQQPAPALQIAQPPRQSKVFADVALFGVAESPAHERAFTVPFRLFGENASMGADYPAPGKATGFPIDIAGGWMFTRLLGAGAAVNRTTYGHSVGLSATIPHPFYFNRPASASGPNGSALSARERTVHTFVTFAPLRHDRMEFRVVGGPSFFWYSANMVENVLYTQSYRETTPSNSIAITGSATRDISGSGIGYHVGGDFTYFVHRLMGLGVAVRYSQGTVTLTPEPLTQLNQDFRVGSTLVALTVRIRVDRAFKH